MSYPPPGPQDPRPQDQNSGWQSRPYQPQGYQPGNFPPGGQAAPPYGQPPRKNRAGLIIILLLVVLLAALGVGGVIAFGLVAGDGEASPDPGPATSGAPPASTPTPKKSVPAPQPSRTVKPPTAKPPVTQPAKPAGSPAELARRFVAQLNANNPGAAIALGCAGTKQFLPTIIEQWIAPPTKLVVGDPIGQQSAFLVPLSGTTKGAAVSGTVVVRKISSDPLCVQVFQVTPR